MKHALADFAGRICSRLQFLEARPKEFARGTIVAQDVCQKYLVQCFFDPFVDKQVLNVEQIPRMLSVQCATNFPA